MKINESNISLFALWAFIIIMCFFIWKKHVETNKEYKPVLPTKVEDKEHKPFVPSVIEREDLKVCINFIKGGNTNRLRLVRAIDGYFVEDLDGISTNGMKMVWMSSLEPNAEERELPIKRVSEK